MGFFLGNPPVCQFTPLNSAVFRFHIRQTACVENMTGGAPKGRVLQHCPLFTLGRPHGPAAAGGGRKPRPEPPCAGWDPREPETPPRILGRRLGALLRRRGGWVGSELESVEFPAFVSLLARFQLEHCHAPRGLWPQAGQEQRHTPWNKTRREL